MLSLGVALWQISLVPLAFLVWKRWRGESSDASYWWIAIALGVSWVADAWSFGAVVAGHRLSGHPLIHRVYPIAQALLVLAVFRDRKDVHAWNALLAVLGVTMLFLDPMPHNDVIVRLAAFGAVCWTVWRIPSLPHDLRRSLLCYFGLGLLAWLGYVQSPTVIGWACMQSVRVFGTAWFCLAIQCQRPRLFVMRAAA